MPGIGMASPSISVSIPAMIFSSVDLPEPFRPSTPIFAPGKKEREMSFRICRFGGTILPTRFMVKTYWAMGGGPFFGEDSGKPLIIAAEPGRPTGNAPNGYID